MSVRRRTLNLRDDRHPGDDAPECRLALTVVEALAAEVERRLMTIGNISGASQLTDRLFSNPPARVLRGPQGHSPF